MADGESSIQRAELPRQQEPMPLDHAARDVYKRQMLLHVNDKRLLLADAKFRLSNTRNLDSKEIAKKVRDVYKRQPQQVRRVLNLFGITEQNHVHENIERNSIQLFSEYLQKYENNKKNRCV